MERMAWTDERLDDLSRRVEQGFATVHADLRDLRAEVHADIGALRSETGSLRAELGAEIASLRFTLLRVGGGIMVGLVGVIGAVLVSG